MLFGLAVAVATLALVSPLHEVSESTLSGHMLQHVLLGDIAPALLVVALRGPLTFFFLPANVLRPLARRRRLRRMLAWLLRPKVSFSVWAVSLGLWHIPAAYDYALTQPLVHVLEHVSFMLGGVLVWVQLVDPARRQALSRAGRLIYAVCLFAAGQALADVLVFAQPLYPSYDDPLFGLSPRSDQQLAGLVMLVEQTVALTICAAFLLRPAVASPRPHVSRARRLSAASAR